uniref:BTB domain-containing protein n=1 Tax=Syphacia muris TaxID=451379 RepID=A0A0N5AL49_9BILA
MTKKWDMEGHERVLSNYCSTCSTLGHLLLDEFSQHVDSTFGLPILVDSLKAKTAGEKIKASVATLYLVRSSAGHLRVYSKFDPLNILIEALIDILSGVSCQEKVQNLAYENGPSLVYQILCSLSNVIDPDKICSLYHFKNEAYNFIMVGGQCIMVDDLEDAEDNELVVFKRETGDVVEKISKKKLIDSSDYFKGMFANEFLEKSSGCSTFVFSEDVEDCTEMEFKQFLHYLCGCRSEKCFKLDNSHSVVVMIKLSDRYLCNSMTDMLLAENGPAIYYMLKGNIREFLSPLLFTGTGECERFEDAFFFHLLRFTTDEEARLTLLPLVANTVATEVFIGKLIRFLKRHTVLNVYFSEQLLRHCEKVNAE